jgi:dipeptidyl aminopeptidase/acylaminoacyl peptidase
MDLNHTKPLLGAKSKQMPALFIHATNDTNIPLEQS